MRAVAMLGLLGLGVIVGGCRRDPPVIGYPPPGYAPSPYANGAPPGTLPPPTAAPPPPGYAPTAPPTLPAPAAPAPTSAGAALPPVVGDAINALDIGFLRQRASGVLAELRAALPEPNRSAVASVPLVVDDAPGEVNAFAACTKQGPLMAITDGLLEISAQMARARATDECFGTQKLSQYVQLVARHQQPKQPVVRPAAGFFDATQDNDGRKVARQHHLLDEQLAFILGHELAHHYLQHTGCVGPRPAFPFPADLGRLLSDAVPVFNQPNELASDAQGIVNVLQAGRARGGQPWGEDGAMLTLNFFVALMQMDPADRLLFAFQTTHPPPELRIPVVQQSARQWRSGGAAPWPLPLPFPGG